MGLISVFIKRKKKKKEKFGTRDRGKTPCEHPDQGDINVSQEMPEAASKPREAGTGAWNRFSLMAFKRVQICQHLAPGLLASRTIGQ